MRKLSSLAAMVVCMLCAGGPAAAAGRERVVVDRFGGLYEAAVGCSSVGRYESSVLGGGARTLGQADDAGARHALSVRSQALNEAYGQREPAWLRALRIRSEGLNRLYGLD